MLAKPAPPALDEPESRSRLRTLGWIKSIDIYVQFFFKVCTWTLLIAVVCTALLIALPPLAPFAFLAYGISGLFLLALALSGFLRYAVIFLFLGKYSLSYLLYNQLLLGVTVALSMSVSGLAVILPVITGCAWVAMIFAFVNEADPKYTRGNQPYFVAKKVAEARMKRRAEEKLKREHTAGKSA